VWQANVEIICDEAPRLVASTWCGGVSMFGSGTSFLGTWSIEFFGAGSSSVAIGTGALSLVELQLHGAIVLPWMLDASKWLSLFGGCHYHFEFATGHWKTTMRRVRISARYLPNLT